jgi:hypothetical protein
MFGTIQDDVGYLIAHSAQEFSRLSLQLGVIVGHLCFCKSAGLSQTNDELRKDYRY